MEKTDSRKLPNDALSELRRRAVKLRLAGVSIRETAKQCELSPEAVAKRLGEQYPKIAAQAKEEGAQIQWREETGLRSDDVRGRGYAPKGKTPVVRANARRDRLSVIWTVTNKGQMRWKVFSGALNAKALIGFPKRLAHGRKRRIFLILDSLRAHRRKAVKKRRGENGDKIAVFYLPSHSPELNPDELLNADLKQRATKAAPARNKMAPTRAAMGGSRSIQKQPERVQSYFRRKHACYAAAQQCFRAGSINRTLVFLAIFWNGSNVNDRRSRAAN